MMENGHKNGIKKEHRLTKLEGAVDRLEKDVEEIKNNHLVHLREKLNRVDVKLGIYVGAISVLTFIAPFLIDKFF